MDLIDEAYSVTAMFPANERYGLATQIHRSAISIASNIAEGRGRWSSREFVRFLSIANGSLKELETQILIAGRRGYASPAVTHRLLERCDEIGRMLTILRRRLLDR